MTRHIWKHSDLKIFTCIECNFGNNYIQKVSKREEMKDARYARIIANSIQRSRLRIIAITAGCWTTHLHLLYVDASRQSFMISIMPREFIIRIITQTIVYPNLLYCRRRKHRKQGPNKVTVDTDFACELYATSIASLMPPQIFKRLPKENEFLAVSIE